MQWLVLAAGSLAGGILSAIARNNRDSVLLRFISFIVPFCFGTAFWIIRIKSGYFIEQVSSFQGTTSIGSKVGVIIMTSLAFAGVSKLLGFIIVETLNTRK